MVLRSLSLGLMGVVVGAAGAAAAPTVDVAFDRLESGLATTTTVTVVDDRPAASPGDQVFVQARRGADRPCEPTLAEFRAGAGRDYLDLLFGRSLTGSGQSSGLLIASATPPGPYRVCVYFRPAGAPEVVLDRVVPVGAGVATPGACPPGTPGTPPAPSFPGRAVIGREFAVAPGSAGGVNEAGGGFRAARGPGVTSRLVAERGELRVRVDGPAGPRALTLEWAPPYASCAKDVPVVIPVAAGAPLRVEGDARLLAAPRRRLLTEKVGRLPRARLDLAQWSCGATAPTRVEVAVSGRAGLRRAAGPEGVVASVANACPDEGEPALSLTGRAGPGWRVVLNSVRVAGSLRLEVPLAAGRYRVEVRVGGRRAYGGEIAAVLIPGPPLRSVAFLNGPALRAVACAPRARLQPELRRARLAGLPPC